MITKPMYWNADKNRKLIEERGISFEESDFTQVFKKLFSIKSLDDIFTVDN